LPAHASETDLQLAHFLSAEFTSRHGLTVALKSATHLPRGRRFILMGTAGNPLVKEDCSAHGCEVSAARPGPEGYLVNVTPDSAVVAGSDSAGAYYGLQSLRQLIESGPDGMRIAAVRIRDWPYTKFRCVKIYAPGRDQIGFYKRFVRDYLALYKYNKLILEMNGVMRLDRHPEVNAGSLDFARDMRLRRLNNPPGLWFHQVNSSHYDTADGGLLEKQEVADLVRWAEANYVEVIPTLPALPHSYYTAAHK
jgi:hypothetical protein